MLLWASTNVCIHVYVHVYPLLVHVYTCECILRQEAGPRNSLPALGLKLDSLVQRLQVLIANLYF